MELELASKLQTLSDNQIWSNFIQAITIPLVGFIIAITAYLNSKLNSQSTQLDKQDEKAKQVEEKNDESMKKQDTKLKTIQEQTDGILQKVADQSNRAGIKEGMALESKLSEEKTDALAEKVSEKVVEAMAGANATKSF